MRRNLKNYTKVFLVTCSMLVATICCYTTTSPFKLESGLNKAFNHLNTREKNTVKRIVENIKSRPEKEQAYYFDKLEKLLTTKAVKPESEENKKFAKNRKDRLVKAVKQVEEKVKSMPKKDREHFLNSEEEYETYGNPEWEVYYPEGERNSVLVYREEPTDIMVKIKVRVSGKDEVVRWIHSLEDAIEKHLYRDGFSVNLEFVDYRGDDVFEVGCDLSKWITSRNWGGNEAVMAHELMHLLGLPDEYDGIASHAENKHLSTSVRLWYFEKQLREPFLPDAKYGIMYNHWNKPLHRHVCSAVGLEEKSCVEERKEYLGY